MGSHHIDHLDRDLEETLGVLKKLFALKKGHLVIGSPLPSNVQRQYFNQIYGSIDYANHLF